MKTSSPLCHCPGPSRGASRAEPVVQGRPLPCSKPCPTWQPLLLISLFPFLAPLQAGRSPLSPWVIPVPVASRAPLILSMANGLSHSPRTFQSLTAFQITQLHQQACKNLKQVDGFLRKELPCVIEITCNHFCVFLQ